MNVRVEIDNSSAAGTTTMVSSPVMAVCDIFGTELNRWNNAMQTRCMEKHQHMAGFLLDFYEAHLLPAGADCPLSYMLSKDNIIIQSNWISENTDQKESNAVTVKLKENNVTKASRKRGRPCKKQKLNINIQRQDCDVEENISGEYDSLMSTDNEPIHDEKPVSRKQRRPPTSVNKIDTSVIENKEDINCKDACGELLSTHEDHTDPNNDTPINENIKISDIKIEIIPLNKGSHQARMLKKKTDESQLQQPVSDSVGRPNDRRGRKRKFPDPNSYLNCSEYKPPLNTCERCGDSYASMTDLREHMSQHGDVREHMCPACGRSYNTWATLRGHMNQHEKKFACTLCTKSFKQRHLMTSHLRTHTGEKPYECEECAKKFSSKIYMNTHKRTVHSNAKLMCIECGRTFKSKEGLRDHTRNHTGEKPYLCHICTKAFATSSSLRLHLQTHTVEGQPNQCDECPMKFKLKPSLIEHKKTHLYGKDHRRMECNVCKETFCDIYYLQTHVRTYWESSI